MVNVCFAVAASPLRAPCHAIPHTGLDVVCARPRASSIVAPSKRRAMVSMGLFGLGFPEIAVIAAVGIFVFGPSKIAEMGKDLGGIAGGVKKATSEFKDAMQESLDEADKEIEAKRIEKESTTTTVAASSSTAESVPTTAAASSSTAESVPTTADASSSTAEEKET